MQYFRTGKSVKTESRFIVARDLGKGEWGLVTVSGYRVFF